MAISYEAGHSDNLSAIYGKHANCPAHARAFQSHGRWHYGLSGARAGDVVFFDWSGTRSIGNIDHVGLIEAVHSNGTITTLEGNTSDMFARRVRNSGVVVGYGRPVYSGGPQPPSGDGILRVGSTGSAVRTLQSNLNEVMGSGLTVDGIFGSATEAAVKAFQQRYRLTVDGEYGPQSAAMMKAALAGKDQPIPPAPKPPPPGPLTVDGVLGPATCAAMQRALNEHSAGLVVDGSMGPLTIKALQRYLGVTVDGQMGPQTITALQRHLGVTADGDWGPDTTRALQTALNAHTF